MIRAMVVNCNPLECEGLRALLSEQVKGLTQVTDPGHSLEEIEQEKPDIILISAAGTGLDVAKMTYLIKERSSEIKVIWLTDTEDESIALQALRGSADGCVSKTNPHQICRAIETVLKGDVFFSHAVLMKSVKDLSSSSTIRDKALPEEKIVPTGSGEAPGADKPLAETPPRLTPAQPSGPKKEPDKSQNLIGETRSQDKVEAEDVRTKQICPVCGVSFGSDKEICPSCGVKIVYS
jgi:DNA-binding NarL/FixJ family response regulator